MERLLAFQSPHIFFSAIIQPKAIILFSFPTERNTKPLQSFQTLKADCVCHCQTTTYAHAVYHQPAILLATEVNVIHIYIL
jgi:hypothetical protein